jgi:uncharacterized protein YcgI (DUF1989 family)
VILRVSLYGFFATGSIMKTVYDQIIPARAPWSHIVQAGQTMRVIDIEGNQAADCIFYNAHDTAERYSAAETLVAQNNLFLTVGSVLFSTEGRPMLTITADNVGRHDTIQTPARMCRKLHHRTGPAWNGQTRSGRKHQLVHECAGD